MILLLLTDGVVGALLTGGGEVDVRGLIPIQALMSPNDGKVEEGDGQARETTHVYFVGGLACSGAQGVVVAALHVRAQVGCPSQFVARSRSWRASEPFCD